MTPSDSATSTFSWRHAALVGFVASACILATLVLAAARQGSVEGEPYVDGSPNSGAINVMLIQGDGQAFAALAQDPTLARPERFHGSAAAVSSEAEAAYRAQRPLLPYTAWALSLGQPGLVNLALLAIAAASATLMVTAFALLLHDRGFRRPMYAVALLALPASLASLSWLGPDLAAIGLATLGVRLWPSRRWGAIALFAVAALWRETALLVPAGLAVYEIVMRRDLRSALQLSLSAVPLAAWLVVVHQRLGAWPWDAGNGRLGFPVAGLLDAMDHWGAVDGLQALALVALGVLAVLRRRDPLAWVVLVTIAFGLVLGWDVWKQIRDIGRVLLPAFAYGLVVLVAPIDGREPADQGARSPAMTS
jgi:hypothetical protein